jgi:hypothetical protein
LSALKIGKTYKAKHIGSNYFLQFLNKTLAVPISLEIKIYRQQKRDVIK